MSVWNGIFPYAVASWLALQVDLSGGLYFCPEQATGGFVSKTAVVLICYNDWYMK
jgi:hypothetical protein